MGEFLPLMVKPRVTETITSPPDLYAGGVFIVFVDFSPFLFSLSVQSLKLV